MEKKYEEITIDAIINKMAYLFDNIINNFYESHEKSLNRYLSGQDYKLIQNKKLLFSEFHVIDCIGKNHLPNATFIAKELDMTKGAISKITAKLLKKDLITANHLENNKRDIYYALTGQGKIVFEIHQKLHKMEREKLASIFHKYKLDDWGVINSFLNEVIDSLQ